MFLALSERGMQLYLMQLLVKALLIWSVYITNKPLQWLVKHTSGPVGELAYLLLLREGALRMRLLVWYLHISTQYLHSQFQATKRTNTVSRVGEVGGSKDSTQ